MPETSAAALHASALVIDMHADTPQRFLDEAWSFSAPLGTGMLNLASARQGNLAAEFFAIWVEPTQHRGHFATRALALLDAVHEQVRLHPNDLQLCLTPSDIRAAHQAGKFGVLLGLEGGHAIEGSLALLRTFFRLGCRYMTLTWNNNNEWADASNDTEHHGGLTPFGREVIFEMNRLGMMVDVSHVSDNTFWQVLKTSAAPVIASHSNARAITPAPRNLTDAQLKALGAQGGVAMVNFFPAFLDDAWRHAWNDLRPAREALLHTRTASFRDSARPIPNHISNAVDIHFAEQLPRPAFGALIDHFEHMLQVAGPEHVGIGSDFDGIPSLPGGISSAADLPRITEALLQRGYSGADLLNILGGNVLRVLEQVQQRANPTYRPES